VLTTGLDAAGGRGGWCCWRAWHRQGPTSGAPAALGRDMGAGAADIAQVVPAVRDNLPDLPALQGGSWRDDRQVINGIIWRTRAGAPWRDLPERRTPCQTCYVGSNILSSSASAAGWRRHHRPPARDNEAGILPAGVNARNTTTHSSTM
jgi:transposase